MLIADLDTPVPVIDLDRVEHNLAKMQAYCDRHALKLRPHIKTHKLPAFAKRAVELGAVGITCQKLGEAEVMAEAGLEDILISYPLIGPAKAARLADLAGHARLRVATDSPMALETVAQAAASSGQRIGVLIEFDSGNKRTGVTRPEDVPPLARAVRDAGLLTFEGLMTYPSTAQTSGFVSAVRGLLATEGIEVNTALVHKSGCGRAVGSGAPFQAVRCDTGMPRRVIRFSAEQATLASVFWAGSVRARRLLPTMAL